MELGFIVKKFISYFIHPYGMFLFLFIVGLLFLIMKKDLRAKKTLILTFGVLFLFSYDPFSNFLVKNLEDQYPKYNYKEKVKYIHVLGGSCVRTIEGILIHNKLSGSKLIFTGYAGDMNISEAKINETLALSLGVNKNDIILGEEAKDTKEEALFTKKLLDKEPFLLVTSATHMPRAMALFKSTGLHPIAAPIDFQTHKIKTYFTLPTLGSLNNSQRAMHEYLGILWSKLRGL
jgi:uncharacterized SAM-binding protein YcdF (DUF218 family)